MPIKGLIFDAYGTLYDVHSVQAKTEELFAGRRRSDHAGLAAQTLNIPGCKHRCRSIATSLTSHRRR